MCFFPTSVEMQVTMMVWFEIKKVLLRPSCQIALILLLLLSGRFCIRVMWGTESAYWLNENDQEETGVAAMQQLRASQKEWSGVLDQELLEKVLYELKQSQREGDFHPEDPNYAFRHNQGLDHIRMLINNAFKTEYDWKYSDYYLAENVDASQLPTFYQNRVTQLKNWLYDENSEAYTWFSDSEKQYLMHTYESIKTPFEVDYTTGWDMAYRVSHYIILYGSILSVFLVSGIFANEFRWRADSVYFSTEQGRKRGTCAKIAAGFLITSFVYWGLLLTINLLTLFYMGFDGGNCPIQISNGYWKSIYNITLAQRTVFSLIDGYLLWMFLSSLVMFVSAASRSVSLAVTIPSLMMLGTDFLDRNGYVNSASKIVLLFPHNMANVEYASRSIALYSFFGKITPAITVQRVMYPCIAIILTIMCYFTFRRKQIH